jgi:hypothetical protein
MRLRRGVRGMRRKHDGCGEKSAAGFQVHD